MTFTYVKREIEDPVSKDIANAIRDVYDPNNVNIYDLGFYRTNYNLEKANAEIVMTLTSPFVPPPPRRTSYVDA